MKKLITIALFALLLSGLLFVSCTTMTTSKNESAEEWKPSVLYVQTPVKNKDGKVQWNYWQLEYNTKTLLLRPMMVKQNEKKSDSGEKKSE
jgi:hypothetical protein